MELPGAADPRIRPFVTGRNPRSGRPGWHSAPRGLFMHPLRSSRVGVSGDPAGLRRLEPAALPSVPRAVRLLDLAVGGGDAGRDLLRETTSAPLGRPATSRPARAARHSSPARDPVPRLRGPPACPPPKSRVKDAAPVDPHARRRPGCVRQPPFLALDPSFRPAGLAATPIASLQDA